jgi:hypothetical protein
MTTALDTLSNHATTVTTAPTLAHLDPGKDYLVWENTRNKLHKKLYTDLLRECFGNDTLIAHHLCFTTDTDVVEEVPSADTLIMDHHIMQRVFGDSFLDVIIACAKVPAETRDEVLSAAFYGRATKLAPTDNRIDPATVPNWN